ncbi:FAD-dependent oxidoreductase [Alicyclobacillus cycloheptanicus]|uniref:Monomeric sarcosine oxidase n=1 Tax=Alicyclobacillus cycloheptanicus TaxID=1457 RepID=A0ABT9XGN6_9BACL|nr:FAD-dependent oxidoreductase [Alicyclobacillus cycloheptanicus]MDQ0189347.1 monomeric sarcosine oxidase [Alicyclobacillus cycloheptanicus]WDM01299.1 FAD-dependent oxidoreductase [Alicyclobacillus cycloheptanicus]
MAQVHTTAHYHTIILGSGSMGLAAGYALARAGVSVLLLDRFEPPHSYGSHHGDTRLLRTAYGEGASYVPLVLRARALWTALEAESRTWGAGRHGLGGPSLGASLPSGSSFAPERLFAPTGVIGILHRQSGMLDEVEASVAAHHLPSEWLTAEAARKRWPGLMPTDDERVHHDLLGGVLFSEACLRALKHGCLVYGAAMRFGGELDALDVHKDGVTVTWDGMQAHADHLLIAAGAGTPRLLEQWLPDWQVPLQPIRKTVAWFKPTAPRLYTAERLPAFYADGPGAMYYGFPDFGQGVKVGRHDGGTPCSPEDVDRAFHPEDEAPLHAFLRQTFPQAGGPLVRGTVCLYTMTPDEHFLIDHHPGHAHVWLAAGFSGHGFKFASAIGEALAEVLQTGTANHDLTQFRAGRFPSHA